MGSCCSSSVDSTTTNSAAGSSKKSVVATKTPPTYFARRETASVVAHEDKFEGRGSHDFEPEVKQDEVIIIRREELPDDGTSPASPGAISSSSAPAPQSGGKSSSSGVDQAQPSLSSNHPPATLTLHPIEKNNLSVALAILSKRSSEVSNNEGDRDEVQLEYLQAASSRSLSFYWSREGSIIQQQQPVVLGESQFSNPMLPTSNLNDSNSSVPVLRAPFETTSTMILNVNHSPNDGSMERLPGQLSRHLSSSFLQAPLGSASRAPSPAGLPSYPPTIPQLQEVIRNPDHAKEQLHPASFDNLGVSFLSQNSAMTRKQSMTGEVTLEPEDVLWWQEFIDVADFPYDEEELRAHWQPPSDTLISQINSWRAGCYTFP